MTDAPSAAHPADRMISLAGQVGSGKSTVARLICERTGRGLFSTGRIFRELAERMGMTVLQLNEYANTHPEVDDEVDGHLRRLAANPEPLVIDSRMAFFFVPASYKVYLVVDPLVGGARVYGAGRKDESYRSVGAAEAEGKTRERVEAHRYHELYGVVRDDWANYDLVVDTTDVSAEVVADVILATLADDETLPTPRCLLAPRRLVPTLSPDPSDTAVDADVTVAVADGSCFVIGGHGTVAAAIAAQVPLIACRLLPLAGGRAPTPDPAVRQAWEEAFGVVFAPPSAPDEIPGV